jgi:regulator of sigma E protease
MHWVGEWQSQPILAAPVAGSVAERAGVHSGDRVLRAGWRDEQLEEVASWQELRWRLMQEAPSGERDWVLELQARDRQAAHEVVVSLPSTPPTDGVMTPEWLGLRGPWMAPVLGELVPGGVSQQAGLRKGDTVVRIQSRVVPDAAALRAWVRESGACC